MPLPRRRRPGPVEREGVALGRMAGGSNAGASRNARPIRSGPKGTLLTPTTGSGMVAYAYYFASNTGAGPGDIAGAMNPEWNGGSPPEGDGDFATYFGFDPLTPTLTQLLAAGWYSINFLVKIAGLSPGDVVWMNSSPCGFTQEVHAYATCPAGETTATLDGSTIPFHLYDSDVSPSPYGIELQVEGPGGYVDQATASLTRYTGVIFPG